MATEFTNVGEFRRGKGQRTIRTGPRMRIGSITQPGSGKVIQSPDQIALRKLIKLLDKPGLTKEDRYQSYKKVEGAEQLRFMNMAVLAQVLYYMTRVGYNVNHDTFNYQAILPYIDELIPKRDVMEGGIKTREISDTEREIMRLRMAATFIRYIIFVTNYATELEQQLQEAERLSMEQKAPIDTGEWY